MWSIMVMTLSTLFCLNTAQVSAYMPLKTKEILRGLPGIATERDGLRQSQLQTEVEQQLKNARMRVLTQEQWKNTPRPPYLYVNVAALKESYGLYAYAIEVCLNQLVLLIRDQQTQEFAETWETREVGPVGTKQLPTVRNRVAAHAAVFIRDYFAVNPRTVTKHHQQRGGV